jgi:hypothetical protein
MVQQYSISHASFTSREDERLIIVKIGNEDAFVLNPALVFKSDNMRVSQ